MNVDGVFWEMKAAIAVDDHEPIVATEDNSGPKPKLKIMNKKMAPPEENLFRVVLELIGAASGEDRPGVDIVAVLDGSGSMKDKRLERLKAAMRILISKLHPMDCLSVITFSKPILFAKEAQLHMSPFHLMTKAGRGDIEKLVNGLRHVDHAPNIVACLQKAVEVLNARKDTANHRAAAILLMSDGNPNRDNGDAAQVPLGDVPLYKFSFSHEYQADGLNAIGNNSRGGIFPLGDDDDLSIAFSQCFAELFDVVVEDLKLTFTPTIAEIGDSKITPIIEKVFAGNCQQSRDDTTGSVTVSMNGELYSGEIRRIMVNVLLPAITRQMTTNVLQISHSYTIKGERFDCPAIQVDAIRTGNLLQEMMDTSKSIEKRDIKDSNNVNMLVKRGQGFLKDALNTLGTRDNNKEKQPDSRTSQAPEGKVEAQETNLKVPTTVSFQSAPLQSVANFVIDEGQKFSQGLLRSSKEIYSSIPLEDQVQESQTIDPVAHLKEQIQIAVKYSKSIQDALKHNQGLLKGEIPNSGVTTTTIPNSDRLQGADKYEIREGQHAGDNIVKRGQEFLHGFGLPFGVVNNKEKDCIPLEDEHEVKTINSLAQLKDHILTTIQLYDSIKESFKSIQDKLNKGEIPDSDHIQGAGKDVIGQDQDGRKYVLNEGRKILKSSQLPFSDSKENSLVPSDALNTLATRDNNKEKQLDSRTAQAPEGKVEAKERDLEVPTTISVKSDPLQRVANFVIDEGQKFSQGLLRGSKEINSSIPLEDQVQELQAIDPVTHLKEQIQIAVKYSKSIQDALKHNQGLLKSEIPDSELTTTTIPNSDHLQGPDKYEIRQSQHAGDYIVKRGQEFLHGFGLPFGGQNNKEKPCIPLEDDHEVKKINSLAQLKDHILTTIRLYDSIKESFKSIQDKLNKGELPDSAHIQAAEKDVIRQDQDASKYVLNEGQKILQSIQLPFSDNKENFVVPSDDQVQKIPEELLAMDPVANLKHQIMEAIHYSNSIQTSFKQHQSLFKGENPKVEMTTTMSPDSDHIHRTGEYMIKQSQDASKFVLNEGQKILQGYGFSFSGMNNKENASIPSEDQVRELESLAHLKDQTKTAIQHYNSVKESLKSIQDTLNKANA